MGAVRMHRYYYRMVIGCNMYNKWQNVLFEFCSRITKIDPWGTICINSMSKFWLHIYHHHQYAY